MELFLLVFATYTWDLYVGPLRAKTVTFPSRTHSYSSLLLLLLLLLLVLLLVLLLLFLFLFLFLLLFLLLLLLPVLRLFFGTYTGDLYAGNAAGYPATTGLRMLKWLYAGYTWHVVRWVLALLECLSPPSYALVALFVK